MPDPEHVGPDPRTFHLQEHKQLSETIESRIKECGTSAQYAILASSAVVSWLAVVGGKSDIDPALYKLAWWVPFVLCLLTTMRAFAIFNRIGHMSKYLRAIEQKYADQDLLGWELRRQGFWGNDLVTLACWLVMLGCAAGVGYQGSINATKAAAPSTFAAPSNS